MHTKVKTGSEENDMEQEIDCMAAWEAKETTQRGSGTEGKDAGEIEVYCKTDDIAYGVSGTCCRVTRYYIFYITDVMVYHEKQQ